MLAGTASRNSCGPRPLDSLAVPTALELIAEHPDAYGRALAVAPDDETWATCDGLRVRIMDGGGGVVAELASPGAQLFGLAFADDGTTLFAAPRALDLGRVEWRAPAALGDAIAADLGPAAVSGFAVHDAVVSSAGLLVVRAEFRPSRAGSREPLAGPAQRVLAFDAATLARRSVLWQGRGMRMGALAAGPQLAAADLGELHVWREDGNAVASIAGAAQVATTALAFSADGACLAGGAADGSLSLWSLPDAQEVAQAHAAHAGHVRAIAFHPDGTRVASCGEDGRVAVWSLSGELLAEADVGGVVDALALSPDGGRLFASTARPDTLVRVYAL
jgi:WD40 repeat protein